MSKPKLLAFAGSLRKGSYNKQLVKAAAEMAKKVGAEITYIDLNDYELPLFNEDLETKSGQPENAAKLKQLMADHDGFIISTPEYNSALPGILKNMIDWVSRKTGDEPMMMAFAGKTAVIMAASPGANGGIRALQTLQDILMNIQITVLPNKVAFGKAQEGFTEDGQIKDEKMANRVKSAVTQLVEVTAKLK